MSVDVPRSAWVWIAIGLAVGGSLLWAKAQGVPATPAEQPPVRVTMQAQRDGKTVSYALTLANESDTELRDFYIAGKVPTGADFSGVGAVPDGSWFRGYEGADTSLQAAVWLAERLPARGVLGPFRYRVILPPDATHEMRFEAQGWVHWRQPYEGTAISAPVPVPGQ